MAGSEGAFMCAFVTSFCIRPFLPPSSLLLTGMRRSNSLLDDQGFLTQDPRSAEWRPLITTSGKVLGGEGLRLAADASAISEVLNVHWAAHEIVSATTTDTLDWWEALGQKQQQGKQQGQQQGQGQGQQGQGGRAGKRLSRR